jgi:uncharacterized repeat protein (TIGR04076 family)
MDYHQAIAIRLLKITTYKYRSGDVSMGDSHEVVVRVISQKGKCVAGHKVGDEFVIGDITPPGFCAPAFYTIFPFLFALQYNAVFPWEKDKDKALVACPDPDNPVIFEITRTRDTS